MATRRIASVIGAPIDAISWDEAIARIHFWAHRHESRYICISNVHSVVTATEDHEFSRVITEADMATPDGAPVAWMLRRLGFKSQQRINGPDLMLRYCSEINGTDESIFLYGSSPDTLVRLQDNLLEIFPDLRIAGTYSPPYRPLTPEEDAAAVQMINKSGAGTVWVSLGCPKQEKWMADHRGRINAVMLGVGAAFDYHAGTIIRAPLWMQKCGLEWFFRLITEPRRLWYRYFSTNISFIAAATRQLIFKR
jgi:N-acetylglucosaminyldiphosphoundecaprenol N-acetyl-beta-D-mannosaminyltransferase